MSDACTLDDILAVLEPGDSCSYLELLLRLKTAGRSTHGCGSVLVPFTEPGGTSSNWLLLLEHDRQRNGELRCWMRDRYWDDEVEGSWSSAVLWIARRPARG